MRFSTRAHFVGSAASVGAVLVCPLPIRAQDSYDRVVIGRGPAAYWPAIDSASSLVDVSGNRHGGVQHASGDATYIEVPSSPQFSIPTSGRGLSVEAWMQPAKLVFPGETAEHYVHWMGKGETGDFEWAFRFYSGDSPSRPNRISAYCFNPDGGLGAGAYFQDTLSTDEWIHVVATFDPGDASNQNAGVAIYRDGVLRHGPLASKATRYSAYGISPVAGNAPLRLGTRDLKSFFSGTLRRVAIYPRTLTAVEIAANHAAGS